MTWKVQNDAQARQSIEQLGRIYEILAGLHAKFAPLNHKNYLVFAEGPMDEIVKLRHEIDEYLGLDETAIVQMQRELAESDAQKQAAERS